MDTRTDTDTEMQPAARIIQLTAMDRLRFHAYRTSPEIDRVEAYLLSQAAFVDHMAQEAKLPPSMVRAARSLIVAVLNQNHPGTRDADALAAARDEFLQTLGAVL